MASLEKMFSEDLMTEPNQATIDNMQEIMAQKATELFNLCDVDQKGYITKSDMQRLRTELPVSADQLDVVFDSLDNDGNGSLTLDEFTDGFGSFLGLRSQNTSRDELDEEEEVGEEEAATFEGQAGVTDQEMEDKMFRDMLLQIGAKNVLSDEDIVKAMWQKLHREEPDMTATFEEFLSKLASDIKKSKVDFQSLEAALSSKNNEHEEEVKKLYEEMELQIKQEREAILAEERAKEKQMRSELENQLKDKEKQLQEILNRHQELEQRLDHINKTEALTKQENERLQKERDQLEEMLSQSQDNLEESRTYIQQMQLQQKDEKRERARAALMLSEGIAIERESLVKQLDILKDVNKRLRDDKDEAEATDIRRIQQVEGDQSEPANGESRKTLCKQGSVLSKYFPGGSGSRRSTELVSVDLDADGLDDIVGDDVDDTIDTDAFHEANIYIPDENGDALGSLEAQHDHQRRTSLRRQHHHHQSSEEEEGLQRESSVGSVGSAGGGRRSIRAKVLMHKLPRSQPVGADSQNGEVISKPQRIFKIVFVGDSGVGKSTFIHRFCHHEFKPNFSATIGVDFQIRTLETRESTVILQLWDTAGQERFRSLTKMYFRKADGVIVMYDVTGETTFMSVRNWMSSVQEQVESGTVMMLLGNKLDMAEDDSKRPVKEKDGMALATEFEMLFYETSAKSGENIMDAMEELTRLLQEKEDKKLEEGLKLTEGKAKKKCCSR